MNTFQLWRSGSPQEGDWTQERTVTQSSQGDEFGKDSKKQELGQAA